LSAFQTTLPWRFLWCNEQRLYHRLGMYGLQCPFV